MRAILRGLIVGLLLSCSRAPLGIDLFDWAAVEGRTSYAWRAVGLVAAAAGLFLARQASLPIRFLLGCAFGFGLHGLLLANAWSPSEPYSLGVTALLGLAALAVLRPSPSEREPGKRPGDRLEDQPENQVQSKPHDRKAGTVPNALEMIGLAAAAAGTAIAVEGVARHVRLLGGTLAQDETVFAWILLCLSAAGGATFGWIAGARALRGLSLPAGLAASAAACFVSLVVIERLSVERSYTAYLRNYGLDPSLRGTLAYDALISGACFVAPGLLLGAALLGARGRERILSILIGGGLGLSLLPGLLALEPGATSADAQASSTELVPFGVLLASGGALVAILSLSDRGAAARWVGIAASLALAAPAILVNQKPIHVLSPWARRPTFPLLVSETSEGLVTVESFGMLGGSWAFATIDRRTITPPVEEIRADSMRLRGSFELLPAERRSGGGFRVLLIGQLTPERATVLSQSGAVRIDRTAAWFEAMPRIEESLWSQVPVELAKPAGSILSPSEAREHLENAQYDLVIVPPASGDTPRIGSVAAPATTTVVRWLGLDEPAQHRDLGAMVALTSDGFEYPALAVLTNGASEEGDGETAPLLLRAGEPRAAPTPLAWLRRRKSERGDDRADRSRAAMMERLAEAAKGTPREDLVTGLAIFHASQERSSQFESLEERTELPDACLSRFRAAVLAGPPSPYLRRTWESLARILVRKRWIEEIYTYLQPVAEQHHPWPALEKALSRADLEALTPADAVSRLERLASSSPGDFEVFDLLGQAHCSLGEGAKALEAWRRAADLPTDDQGARRRVTLAVARTGDPAGIAAAKRLLLETPADQELLTLVQQPIGAGPPSDPCAR